MEDCESDVSQFMLDDLQLAAELGKTLLERNKELETQIKEYKFKADEQEREIVHLRKHINAMTEVNDSRLKVYEQLEVGIQDLERANQRLNVEKSRDKKQIKLLAANAEGLEARCEELAQQLSDARQSLNSERRKVDRYQQERHNMKTAEPPICFNTNSPITNDQEMGFPQLQSIALASPENISLCNANLALSLAEKTSLKSEDSEELVKLLGEMETIKRDFLTEQQRCAELEEQLVAIIQENQCLQGRMADTSANQEMMSMHEELSLLDDVRQGQMCSRCLRDINESIHNLDEQSSVAPTEEIYEDDERSMLSESTSKFSHSAIEDRFRKPGDDLQLNAIESSNPYRDLVEKYEALLEVQRTSIASKNLADAKKTSDLNPAPALQPKEDTIVSSSKESVVTLNNAPIEFSEAETSSSGFSDGTGNKFTQTDERPSSFLCSISNGNDCKFSIYDDVSPIESHFRNRPEHRELFKEIFGVLKKAADNNENEDKQGVEASGTAAADILVPQAAIPPLKEESPEDFIDDTQSVVSSIMSSQSIAISECVTKLERKTAKKHILSVSSSLNTASKQGSVCEPSTMKPIEENGRVLTPLKREPLEYITIAVGIKKKNRRKHRNQSSSRDRVDLIDSRDNVTRNSPLATRQQHQHHMGQGSVSAPLNRDFGRGISRRGNAPSSSSAFSGNWNGSPMVIYNQNMNTPRTSRGHNTVSQDLHKLKKLDLSYAEVLRRADPPCDYIPSKMQHSQRQQQSNGSNSRKNRQRRQ
ncbi:cerebellar degeneration-related protein 2-like [Drosophila serrata]|uniref:cerebellar degeneration-related protein 2-like n=1 Tax=Drosophila serrata TaxID=7274 RepID=UPI000A1D2585|nr:cerebellar degeneration-related protein 2-like [Drosophila serrata]XP_020811024.1 cerebellar degeneration-related protein 2-like [Drosophila serrata]